MAKMRAVQVSRPKAALEVVEREVPQPGPGTEYPLVPGHEVIGIIDALGPGVSDLALAQRVGVGWNGGYDGRRLPPRTALRVPTAPCDRCIVRRRLCSPPSTRAR